MTFKDKFIIILKSLNMYGTPLRFWILPITFCILSPFIYASSPVPVTYKLIMGFLLGMLLTPTFQLLRLIIKDIIFNFQQKKLFFEKEFEKKEKDAANKH